MKCVGKHEVVKANGGNIEQRRDETMGKVIQPRWVGVKQKGFSCLRPTILDGHGVPIPFTACLRTLLVHLPSLVLSTGSFQSSFKHAGSYLLAQDNLLLLHHILLHLPPHFLVPPFRKTLWKGCLNSLSPLLIQAPVQALGFCSYRLPRWAHIGI